MYKYEGDLTVRRAENGVIVTQSNSPGCICKEFVFTYPHELSEWMRQWHSDLLVADIKLAEGS